MLKFLTAKLLTGQTSTSQQRRKGSGIVLRSGVNGKQGVTVTVSILFFIRRPKQTLTLTLVPSALYEADKLAHEEAVQNGGVSPTSLHMKTQR